jgi:DNA-directed RNA polymerase delta subunit
MDLSNKNGKSEEVFLSKSVSFSKANINGLRTGRYYDRKKKLVYAIAYVNIKQLISYYRNLLSSNLDELKQKLREGKSFVQMNDKENALRSFYEGMPLLSEIDEAQMLLIALNKKEYVDLYSKRVREARLELNEEINKLQQSKELSLGETAYFVAYGLYVQLKDFKGALVMDFFTYENTGLESAFSRRWNDELADALLKAGLNNVRSFSEAMANAAETGGNYWTEGTALRIHARVMKDGELLAVSEGSIPISRLKQEGIDYLPPQLEKVRELDNIHLKAMNPSGTFKVGKASEQALMVQVKKNESGQEKPMSNVPLLFIDKQNGRVLCTGKSDAAGLAKGYLPAIQFDGPVLEVEAVVDIADFAGIDTNTIYYTLVQQQNTMLPARFELKTEHQTFFIESEELLLGRPMDIETIEPVIKQYLADKGYHFTDKPAEADFIVRIKASTTAGTYYSGIYFTYIDANLSITDNSNGDEVFKTHIDQAKGGGANYTKAGKKAYTIAAAKLKESLEEGW